MAVQVLRQGGQETGIEGCFREGVGNISPLALFVTGIYPPKAAVHGILTIRHSRYQPLSPPAYHYPVLITPGTPAARQSCYLPLSHIPKHFLQYRELPKHGNTLGQVHQLARNTTAAAAARHQSQPSTLLP